MKCFPITFVLMAAAETLLAAVMSGVNHLTEGQEVEENLIISRRKGIAEHDHRTDPAYSGIFGKRVIGPISLPRPEFGFYSGDQNNDDVKHLEPYEMKIHMRSVLESMDKNKNGMIEKNELTDKLLEVYRKLSAEESDSEFQTSDLDENGYITWKEYIGDTYASSSDINEDEMAQEEKELFMAADIDKDNQLNQAEFRYFYTPEDYPHMKEIVINGVMGRFDFNKDGKITLDEFMGERSEHHTDYWYQEEKAKFDELDFNKDGLLEENEIHNWASPNNNMIAESEAENLIFKSDQNKDGMLSFDEVLENYQAFISTDSDSYYIFKDEL